MIELELRPARIEDLPLFVALVRSDSPEPGELNASEQALRAEFGEIGDNRMIYLAFAEGEVTAGAQLVLESADNDPELADGTNIAHVHHLRVAYQCQTGHRAPVDAAPRA